MERCKPHHNPQSFFNKRLKSVKSCHFHTESCTLYLAYLQLLQVR